MSRKQFLELWEIWKDCQDVIVHGSLTHPDPHTRQVLIAEAMIGRGQAAKLAKALEAYAERVYGPEAAQLVHLEWLMRQRP